MVVHMQQGHLLQVALQEHDDLHACVIENSVPFHSGQPHCSIFA